MSAPLLSVRDLRVHYAGRSARRAAPVRGVDGVSFELEPGGSLGLVGESGCGKSSLARALIGLERASAGSIRLDGVELCGLAPRRWRAVRRRVQMVFQDPYSSLDPRQTVAASLTEPLAIHSIGRRRERLARALSLLEAVGLGAIHLERYPHELSGGQRQRVAIARALALEPELLVLDEPLSALDVSVRAQVLQLLRDLRERFGLTYLFIAHDLALVRLLCADVAVMYLGRLVEVAPRDELFGAPRHPYTQGLLSAVAVPDPARARRRARSAPIGEVPSPSAPPSGCRFHPRCPERQHVPEDRCAREEPELAAPSSVSATRVACHLYPSAPSERRAAR